MKSLVIIPTYNEADNIAQLIEQVLPQDPGIEILVVDDNSPDNTSGIVRKIQQDQPRVHLLSRAGKLGLGSAYVEGFKYGLARDYDAMFEMDADFSHDPQMIPKMLAELEKSDLVIGSRYIKGINVVNWPLSRLILSYMAAFYVRAITGMPVKDPTGGFKCFRREVLQAIDLDGILSDGYSFQVEMNYRTWLLGFRIKEIPIIFTDRRSGQSKMSNRIIREAIYMVWKLRWLALCGKIPSRN